MRDINAAYKSRGPWNLPSFSFMLISVKDNRSSYLPLASEKRQNCLLATQIVL